MEDFETIKLNDKVKVPNHLTTDPYNKKGETGKIIDINLEKWCYVLKFEDGTTGIYSCDAVELITQAL